jgi:hypothetical protein
LQGKGALIEGGSSGPSVDERHCATSARECYVECAVILHSGIQPSSENPQVTRTEPDANMVPFLAFRLMDSHPGNNSRSARTSRQGAESIDLTLFGICSSDSWTTCAAQLKHCLAQCTKSSGRAPIWSDKKVDDVTHYRRALQPVRFRIKVEQQQRLWQEDRALTTLRMNNVIEQHERSRVCLVRDAPKR